VSSGTWELTVAPSATSHLYCARCWRSRPTARGDRRPRIRAVDRRPAARRHGRHRPDAPRGPARSQPACPTRAFTGSRGSRGRDLSRTTPIVDRASGFPDRSSARSPARRSSWPSLAAARRGIASGSGRSHAGLVLDFHGDFRRAFSGTDRRAVALGVRGPSAEGGKSALHDAPVPAGIAGRRARTRNLDLVSALGLPVSPVPDAGITIGAAAGSAARSSRSLSCGGDTRC
jgi:hypothetical protein